MWERFLRRVNALVFEDVCLVGRRVVLHTLGNQVGGQCVRMAGVLFQICHDSQIMYMYP